MIDTEPLGSIGDYMPLSGKTAILRHREILDSLRLELKIAADGFDRLRGTEASEICRLLQRKATRSRQYSSVFNAACAVYCHELYFQNLVSSERFPSLPQGRSAELLKDSFGSADNFFYLIRTLAKATSSPAFLWLYRKERTHRPMLGIARLPLYTLPDLTTLHPIMCIDLWEHAYLDRWNGDIGGYADAYLRQADWDKIFSEPYAKDTETVPRNRSV